MMIMRDLTAALKFIKEFEGFQAKPYLCPAGYWTIGYGHLILFNGCRILGNDKRHLAEMIIKEVNESEAIIMLRADLRLFIAAIDRNITVPLTDNQFCALLSFIYNIGIGAFRRSKLFKKLNAREYFRVPGELQKWNKGGGKVLVGLKRRRQAEADLWNTN